MSTLNDVFVAAREAHMEVAIRSLEAARGIAKDYQLYKDLGDDAVRYEITCYWGVKTRPSCPMTLYRTTSTMSLAEAISRAERKYYGKWQGSSNQLEVIVVIGNSRITLTDKQIVELTDGPK